MFVISALGRAVFSAILRALTVTSPVTADSTFATATAVAVRFDAQAGQNIVDIQETLTAGDPFAALFLTYVDATGGAARWGAPISAAFEEPPGTLTQYFERDVIDWGRLSRDGIKAMQPRLVWDHLGGGLGGRWTSALSRISSTRIRETFGVLGSIECRILRWRASRLDFSSSMGGSMGTPPLAC